MTAETASRLHPAVMMPLLDRPFLQHVVEYLVLHGIRQIDFVLSHMPEQIEAHFGEGHRWGVKFSYHLARDPLRPYNSLKTILHNIPADEPVLSVHGDRLPVDEAVFQLDKQEELAPRTFVFREGTEADAKVQATGWQWIMPSTIAMYPRDMDSNKYDDLAIENATSMEELVEVTRPLSAQSYGEIIDSQRRVLNGEAPGLLVSGREVEPGIWISRNVSFPSSVKMIAPLYLGANSRIGRGVTLGPNVVIGEGCVLDQHCTVRDSLIIAGSYVGESLELTDLVVDKNRVINTRLGVDYPVSEDFIVGSMAMRPIHDRLAGIFSRMVAICILLASSPLLLLTALYLKISRAGNVWHLIDFVRLPAPHSPSAWKVCRRYSLAADDIETNLGKPFFGRIGYLLLVFLPALINILTGELHFVGVRPRSKRQLENLPIDWRELVLCSKAGIITEAFVRFGASPSDDEMYSAEAFYAVRAGIRHDFKLAFGWLARILFGSAEESDKNAADNVPDTIVQPGFNSYDGENAAYQAHYYESLHTTSGYGSLDLIRRFIDRICREKIQPPMDEEDAFKVAVAVQEAVTNVMRHAYHGRNDGDICLEAQQQRDLLTIRILHSGEGFDPSSVPEPRWDSAG